MKQSLRSRRPPVEEITDIADVAGTIREYHCAVLADPSGRRLELKTKAGERITKPLLISGPEAGFTADERQQLIDSGAVPFSLGTRRLRAETAAIAALTLLMHNLDEL
jgi:16S rRNA (uracil1498-N3)-methyltransferase